MYTVSSSQCSSVSTQINGETSKSYQLRERHLLDGMLPVLDKFFPMLGFAGVQACTTFVGVPVNNPPLAGAELTLFPTAPASPSNLWQSSIYNLVLFNSLHCPGLAGDRQSHAGTTRLPVGKLRFGCYGKPAGTNLRQRTMLFPEGDPRSAIYTRTPSGEVSVSETPPQEVKSVSPPWLSHSWGCDIIGKKMRTNFNYSAFDTGDVDRGASDTGSFYHAHLPASACDRMRRVGRASLFDKVQVPLCFHSMCSCV